MRIKEITKSIEKEGLFAGRPAVFIKTYGCELNCSWCPSRDAVEGDDYTEMSSADIVNRVLDTGIVNVTITGGEPLLHDDIKYLVKLLRIRRINVNIETSGACDLSALPFLGRATITLGYKLPSSGMSDKMIISNFKYLSRYDVLKFVVGSDSDLTEIKNILDLYKPVCRIFISPAIVDGVRFDTQKLIDFLIDNKYSTVRLSVPLV